MEKGREEYEKVLNKLHQQLRQHEDDEKISLTRPVDNIQKSRYSHANSFPLWGIFAGTASIITLAFTIYSLLLSNKTSYVLQQLNKLLQ